MKRVVSIDGVALDNNCFISTEFNIDDFIGERDIAIDGSSIMYVQAKGSLTNEVQITSNESGWVHEDTKNLLISTVDNLGKNVVFDDTSNATYYYDHSKTPLLFEALYEGSLWYNVTINLLKG